MRNALLLMLAAGCGSTGSDFGATPGGVKDLHLARELVKNGQVPPSAALLVEAMFAEHDLPVEGAPCASTLCVRAAAGFAPELDGTPRGWAQLGLSSTIDPATWQRPSTTFVFTVDVSGSMGWDRHDDQYPPASQLARKTLHALTDQLRADDRVAIVTYGSDVDTALGLTSGADHEKIHAAIDALSENGSTNMEAGMKRAYEVGSRARGSTEQVRVIVFTDEQPNVGATTASEFNTIVGAAAQQHVDTSVLAYGLGIGAEVMRGMASLRGANAFGMTRLADVDQFMTDNYPWFTTPIAYDLRINAALAPGWSIDRGLGFPEAADHAKPGLEASTVFLSNNRGALLVALTPTGATPDGLAGSFSLAYTEPSGEAATAEAPFAYDLGMLDDRGQWFAQHGVARTTALALFTEGMHLAATKYEASDAPGAELVMAAAQQRFTSDASSLADDDLAVEVELGGALLQLIHARAPQGSLYGAGL